MKCTPLVVTQLAALAFVGKEIFLATDFERSLGLNFVFTLVVFLPTVIGHNWQAQAVYQVSYIFVAYELPMLGRIVNDSKNKSFESNSALWVLSNRAKSVVPLPVKSKKLNVYLAGSELLLFHSLQIILSILIIIFAVSASGSSWFALSKQPVEDHIRFTLLWSANLVCMGGCVYVCIYYWRIARTIVSDATKHWIDYFNGRTEHDKLYLSQFDKSYLSKLGLHDFVFKSIE